MSERNLIGRVACILFLCAACNAGQSHGGDGQSGDGKPQAGNPSGNSQTGTPSDANKSSDSKPQVADGNDDKGGTGGAAPSKNGNDDKNAGSAGMAEPTDVVDAGMHMGNLPNTIPSARGKCDLDTGFPDDNACLSPPDPGEGMQIHIGPTDYDDPIRSMPFVMHPGDESSECVASSATAERRRHLLPVVRVLSGRPARITSSTRCYKDAVEDSVGFTVCMNEFSTDPGPSSTALPGASKRAMPRTRRRRAGERAHRPQGPSASAARKRHALLQLTERHPA